LVKGKMNNMATIEILQTLAEGMNPLTGEAFAPGSPYQDVRVVRALYRAIEALKVEKQRRDRPGAAGKAWSDVETRSLAQEFDSHMPIAQIAEKHQRTEVAIAARLVKIGKIGSREEVLGQPPA
jgi:hypothetical protein